MPDLEDQLRIYYEATTEPVDVDSVTVDPGTVIVGPFPEAAKRRSGMTTPTDTRPWWRNAWAAAAAFVVVVLVGAGVVLATTGNGTAPPAAPATDTTTAATSTTAGATTTAAVTTTLAALEEPALAFDGTACTYEGPSTFAVGETVSFALTNAADTRVNLSLWKVPEGTTEAELVAHGIDFGFDELPEGYTPILYYDPGSPAPTVQAALTGMTIHREHTFEQAGRYALNCSVSEVDASATSPAGNYPVLLDVVE